MKFNLAKNVFFLLPRSGRHFRLFLIERHLSRTRRKKRFEIPWPHFLKNFVFFFAREIKIKGARKFKKELNFLWHRSITGKKNVKINTQRSTAKKREMFSRLYSEFDPPTEYFTRETGGYISNREPRGYINSNFPYYPSK